MKRFFGISFVLLWSVVAVVAQSDLQPLATVKLHTTESITLRQLKTRVEAFEEQNNIMNSTLEQKKEILNAMIDEKLVMQAALAAGMTITDPMIDDYFLQAMSSQIGQLVTEPELDAMIKAQYGMSLDDYIEVSTGMDLAEYKAFLKTQLTAQQYVMQIKGNEIQQNSAVTDTEIRSFYEINKASLVQNDILKLFLVIVPKGNNAAAAKTLATSLHSDLKGNKTTYDELRLMTQNPDSGFQAGDMYISKGTLAAQELGMNEEEFLDLFKQNVGFFDDVTEMSTDYRFYIVQEKYDAKMLALDDLIQPGTTVTVYEYIREQLTMQKQQYAFIAAIEEVVNSLRVPENYQMLKTDSALNTLLTW